jgi:two-component sensor histidine kinase
MGKYRKCNDCSLLAEADHRIANHYAMLASHVRLKAEALARQPTEPSRSEMRLLLESIGVHIDSVASLHRILTNDRLQSSTDLSQHLHNICHAFRSGPSSDCVLAEDFEPGCALPLDQLLPVTQIFAEVITNAIKYSHTNGEAGTIRARCGKEIGGAIVVEVIDEGGGLPKGVDPKTANGLGFRLVRTLSQQVGGLLDYQSSSKGLRFRLTLPPSSTLGSIEGVESRTLRQRLSIFHMRRNGHANGNAAASGC